MPTPQVPGQGVDLDLARRPGVPKERPPQPAAGASLPIEPQHSDVEVLVHKGKPRPPVFGTVLPPRGLAGLLRRYAFRYPDHWTRHWMVLMLADRVDVLEHAVRRRPALVPLLLLGVVSVRLLRR